MLILRNAHVTMSTIGVEGHSIPTRPDHFNAPSQAEGMGRKEGGHFTLSSHSVLTNCACIHITVTVAFIDIL